MADEEGPKTYKELLKVWQEGLKSREEFLEKRHGNMFLGPIGLEEQVGHGMKDIIFLYWHLNRMLEMAAVKEDEYSA